MGAIQGAINSALGTAATAVAGAKHILNQQKQISAEAAETGENLEASKKAYRNDTIEAATAISAHEQDFNPKIGGKKFKDMNAEDVAKLEGKDIEDLAKAVDAFRSSKLTEDRISRMQAARDYQGAPNVRKGKLRKAYLAFEELNDRIAASRALKFDIEAAEKKLRIYKGDKR